MQQPASVSLKLRFLLAFAFSTLVLLIALGGLSFFVMYNHLKNVQEGNLRELADYAADEINYAIADHKELLLHISHAREVQEFPETYRTLPLAKYLAEYREELPDIGFVGANGNEELRVINGSISNEISDYSDDASFQSARENPGRVIVARHPSLDALVLTLGLQRYFGDVFLGCLRSVVPLRNIRGHLATASVGKTGFLALLEANGSLFPLSSLDAGLQMLPKRNSGDNVVQPRDGSILLDTSLGFNAFSAYAETGQLSWQAVAVLPYEEFIAGPRHLTKVFVGLGGPLLLVGCLLALYLGRRLTVPLRRLTTATSAVGGGRWLEIEIGKAPGEVAELIHAFNEMTRTLKSTVVSRDYLDNVVDSMHESLLVIGLDGKIERANRATCELLDYQAGELVGQPIGTVLAEVAGASDNWIDQVTRTTGHSCERTYKNKQGEKLPVSFSWARFSDPGGKTHGLICLAHSLDPGRRPVDWRKRTRPENSRSSD